jgi:hypothetical protein
VKAGFRRDVVYHHAWQGAVYGVQWPLGKSSQQCRKSSLCTASYDTRIHDTVPLESAGEGRAGIIVCVCVNRQFVSFNSQHSYSSLSSSLQPSLSLSLLLYLTCICLACRNLTHHSHTPLLGYPLSVTQPTPSNRQRTLYPDFDPSMRHKRN